MQNFLSLAHLGQNSPWRWFKTELFTFLWTLPGSIPLLVLIELSDAPYINLRTLGAKSLGVHEAVFLAVILLPFFTALFGFMRLIERNHERHWKTAVTSRSAIDFRRMLVAGGIWAALLLLSTIISFCIEPSHFTWQFDPVRFFPMVVVAFVFIPFQAFFEEFAIRGYLMQNVALVSKRVWQALLSTTFTFAWLHSKNLEVQTHGTLAMMPIYGLIGLTFGIATLMDNGIELAAGAHIANNLFACIILSAPDSTLQTPALMSVSVTAPTWWSYLELAIMGAVFLFVMAKKYQWSAWSLLWSRIEADGRIVEWSIVPTLRYPGGMLGLLKRKTYFIPTKKPRLLQEVLAQNNENNKS